MEFNKFTGPSTTKQAVPTHYQSNNKEGIIYYNKKRSLILYLNIR